MMTKHLSPHGNSLALVIDKGILSLLGINEKTSLEITTDGRGLYVAPSLGAARRRRFEEAASLSHKKYGTLFKALAESDK